MSNSNPLISIIMTSYNYAHYIAQSIQSVLDQTYQYWELIISDDGSTDNSLEVIYSFHDPRIHVISVKQNQGAGAAYKAAYECCIGEYIVSLDSDDAMVADRLNQQLSFFANNPDIDVLGTHIQVIDGDGRIPTETTTVDSWFNLVINLNDPASWVNQNRLCHSSVMIKKQMHDRVGTLNNTLVAIPDYEFWVRCLAAGARFAVIAEPLTLYRNHTSSATSRFSYRSGIERIMLFCEHFWSLLLRLGRSDLIEQSVKELIESPSFSNLPIETQARGLDVLTNQECIGQGYDQLLAELKRPPTERSRALIAILRNLQDRLAWLESQLANWQSNATEQTSTVVELQNWISIQAQGKVWLEEQVQKWRHETKEYEVLTDELRSKVIEYEKCISDLQAQCVDLETRQTTLIAEYKHQTALLESEYQHRIAAMEAYQSFLKSELEKTEWLRRIQRRLYPFWRYLRLVRMLTMRIFEKISIRIAGIAGIPLLASRFLRKRNRGLIEPYPHRDSVLEQHTEAISDASAPEQPAPPEQPVLPANALLFDDYYPIQATPRYGYGRPTLAGIHAILDQGVPRYKTLLESFQPFSEQMLSIPVYSDPQAPQEPAWINGFFPGLDSITLYGMVSILRPSLFLEIGSGNSTKFVARARRHNSPATRIISIDPYPRAEIDQLCDEVIRTPLENVDMQLFQQLSAGDILFFDGSHRVFQNSDVTVFFLEILPALASGVYVHIHDILWPHDYPPDWAERYYSEQYMLGVLLLFGQGAFEVVLPNRYLTWHTDYLRMFDIIWEHPSLADVHRHGGSFWMRKR